VVAVYVFVCGSHFGFCMFLCFVVLGFLGVFVGCGCLNTHSPLKEGVLG